VAVDLNPWIAFLPGHPRETGFILYPGARVDPRVYARAARAIAEHGYPTLIVPMPLNLALLAPEQGLDVIGSFPQVKRWAIGGHSLGGAMAARFALNQPSLVSYKLEAETGFELTLPAPSTVALDAGVHTLTYTLEFPSDVTGAAQFHVTAPEDITSNTVNFTLTCQ